MDFWSRLVGSVGGTLPVKHASANSSHQRLDRFKKVHKQLLQIWYKDSSERAVCGNLEVLNRILEDEIRSPAPHPCIAYVASSQVYDVVATIAQSFASEHTIHVALKFFNVLVDNEEGAFVEDESFADALVKCLQRISSSGSSLISAQTELDLAEILFGVAAKIRLQPRILPVWFRPRTEASSVSRTPSDSFASSNPNRRDFPLFYLLVEYVHYDGRVGDFARTGLLYLLGSSAHTEELEKWIVESELPAMMASGLGALYSRLSRKLVLSFGEKSVPAIAAFSEVQISPPAFDVEVTGSPDFQAILGTFLSYLVFWQDTLEQCPSKDVELILLDHFKLLFLQQLLYPSLVESSDADGGSSVAVLTYLRFILGSLRYPDLIELIMQYLFALPEAQPDESKGSRPTTLARRRKSYTLRRDLAKGEEKPSPNLFTLVDLILTSLESHNQQTVTATLRLCSTILSKHHSYTISTLVKIHRLKAEDHRRTLKIQNFQLDTLLSLAEDLATNDGLKESYENHLYDVQNILESHSCSSHLLAFPGMDNSVTDEIRAGRVSTGSKPVEFHAIALDDPLLLHLLTLLKSFLVNDIETNLGLTHLFTTLASCGYTSINGWLLGDMNQNCPSGDQDVSSVENFDRNDDQSPGIINDDQARKPMSSSSPSPVYATFDCLIEQVKSFRQKIQDFDIFLAERRHIFKVNEEMETTLADTSAPSRVSEDSNSAFPTQLQKPSHLVSLSRKLLTETTSSNVSRASSPRGRQQDDPSSALAKKLGYLRVSPSPSPSKGNPRTYSASPLRRRDPSPPIPPKHVTPMGPPDALRQKIQLSTAHPRKKKHLAHDAGGSEASSVRSGSIDLAAAGWETEEVKEVTLGHLLTNIIILQEFMLELGALIEVRATLFGEVQ